MLPSNLPPYNEMSFGFKVLGGGEEEDLALGKSCRKYLKISWVTTEGEPHQRVHPAQSGHETLLVCRSLDVRHLLRSQRILFLAR